MLRSNCSQTLQTHRRPKKQTTTTAKNRSWFDDTANTWIHRHHSASIRNEFTSFNRFMVMMTLITNSFRSVSHSENNNYLLFSRQMSTQVNVECKWKAKAMKWEKKVGKKANDRLRAIRISYRCDFTTCTLTFGILNDSSGTDTLPQNMFSANRYCRTQPTRSQLPSIRELISRTLESATN